MHAVLQKWYAAHVSIRRDLESLTGREVRLQLIRSGAFGEPDVDADAVTIGWRDSWESPSTAPP
jgi:hypothetical protein